MSSKLYTVKCSVHGEYDVQADKYPTYCKEVIGYQSKKPIYCYEPLRRVYAVPNVHYKGSGWAGKEK